MLPKKMMFLQQRKRKKEGDSVEKLKAEIEKKDNEIQSLKTKSRNFC